MQRPASSAVAATAARNFDMRASPCWRRRMQSCPTPPPRQISGCTPTNSTESALVRALSRCVSCGVAQRHEPCHARVVALLDGGGAPNRSFEFAQRKLARRNSSACRRPCQLHTSPDSWASLLAGLSAFARDARPQWSSKQGRDALLREWAAIARQRLEEGWHGAAACRARAAQPRPPTQRFLVLDGGGEQQHKNKWVLLDALYVARAAGWSSRTLRTRDSSARTKPEVRSSRCTTIGTSSQSASAST